MAIEIVDFPIEKICKRLPEGTMKLLRMIQPPPIKTWPVEKNNLRKSMLDSTEEDRKPKAATGVQFISI